MGGIVSRKELLPFHESSNYSFPNMHVEIEPLKRAISLNPVSMKMRAKMMTDMGERSQMNKKDKWWNRPTPQMRKDVSDYVTSIEKNHPDHLFRFAIVESMNRLVGITKCVDCDRFLGLLPIPMEDYERMRKGLKNYYQP